MRRSKGQGHEQPAAAVHIVWRSEPPSPTQIIAWRQLWVRLLGQMGQSGPDTRQPQAGEPGAENDAAVMSGSHNVSEHTYDTTHHPQST